MDSLYEPAGVEERWQRTWEEEGLYNADPDPSRRSFAIAHPPPNVTGDLHLGHALQLSLADTIVRTRRMQGYNVLFQPGFDHAGISTQNAVEKHLASEGKSRQDLGREAFVRRVWEWLHEYGGKIMFQFRRTGASLDYRRERFTMDDAYIRAVMRFFVHLYRKELDLSREPDHQLVSVPSDLALGPRAGAPRGRRRAHATCATRSPKATATSQLRRCDQRRSSPTSPSPCIPRTSGTSDFVGREVIVPFVERRVPVIADERVEREFGTGALKVTPGHDPMDYEIGRDHGLPELTVIGPDGRMNDAAGELAGLTQEEADERVLAWLKDHDQLEKRESYRHTVAVCDRCKTPDRAAHLAAVVVLDGGAEAAGAGGAAQRAACATTRSRSTGSRSSRSRTRRTGTSRARSGGATSCRVWECPDGHVTVEETDPEACAECGSQELTRSTDVLDTWFSSALWPFATLGWPEDTEDLRTFYPGDLNTTARDIIRLWENRMIFSGLELMGDIPFTDVVIHSTVHAPTGGRMSKSLGTGMNPLAVIDAYGADAMRYGLMKMASSQDVRFSEGAIDEGRKLANKLWNVARLIIQASDGATPVERPQTLEEHWILARLSQTQRDARTPARRVRLLALRRRAVPPDVRRLLRLVRRSDQGTALRRRRGRACNGDCGARASAQAAASRRCRT